MYKKLLYCQVGNTNREVVHNTAETMGQTNDMQKQLSTS